VPKIITVIGLNLFQLRERKNLGLQFILEISKPEFFNVFLSDGRVGH